MSILDEVFQCEHCDRQVTAMTTCGYLGCDRYSPRFEEGNDEEYMEEEVNGMTFDIERYIQDE